MGKILIYPLTESIGGVEEYEMNLVRYSSTDVRERYGYIILGENSPYCSELSDLGVKSYILPKRETLLSNIFETYHIFKKLRDTYDVIYFNTSAIGYVIPYLFAIYFDYSIVLHSHLDGRKISSPIKKIVQSLNYRLIKNSVDLKLACSTEAAEWLFCGQIKDVYLIPNSIDLHRFKFDPIIREKVRSGLGLKDDVVIGNVSRLTKVKNQEFLIKIIKKMKTNGLKVKLLLVGDGEDKDKLKYLVDVNGLDDNVIFYGQTQKPEYIMNAMDCIVLPSLTEGFPISIIEAQAAGLKCILSDTITKEVNVTGDVKYLSLNEDLEKWSNEIEMLDYNRNDNYKTLNTKGFNVLNIENLIYGLIKNNIKENMENDLDKKSV